MNILLGGYFETALVTWSDAILRPDRNETTHGYYMCLNRRVSKEYFDRAATFIILADYVIVPSIDWALAAEDGAHPELEAGPLGISINGEAHFGGREWDDDTRVLADIVIDSGTLSATAWTHVSAVDERRVGTGDESTPGKIAEIRRQVGHHYLCRIFLHIRAAAEAKALLVLSEPDLDLLNELGRFFEASALPLPFAFPDVTDRTINGDDFAGGMLNFSPPDALAMIAAKNDPLVRKYADRIAPFITDTRATPAEAALLSAMRETYEAAEETRKAEKMFEIAGWLVKPLAYVPALGTAISIATDAKDVVNKWLGRTTEDKEWYLLAARMTEIATKDYLGRKGNRL